MRETQTPKTYMFSHNTSGATRRKVRLPLGGAAATLLHGATPRFRDCIRRLFPSPCPPTIWFLPKLCERPLWYSGWAGFTPLISLRTEAQTVRNRNEVRLNRNEIS